MGLGWGRRDRGALLRSPGGGAFRAGAGSRGVGASSERARRRERGPGGERSPRRWRTERPGGARPAGAGHPQGDPAGGLACPPGRGEPQGGGSGVLAELRDRDAALAPGAPAGGRGAGGALPRGRPVRRARGGLQAGLVDVPRQLPQRSPGESPGGEAGRGHPFLLWFPVPRVQIREPGRPRLSPARHGGRAGLWVGDARNPL